MYIYYDRTKENEETVEYLSQWEYGAGCTEIWEHLRKVREE